MTPEQIAGSCYRTAIDECRAYYLRGFPQHEGAALIVVILDKIDRDAAEIFSAAQPGKSFDTATSPELARVGE